MTSLKSSNLEPEVCPKCGGPIRERPARRFPVVLQLSFAASFALFLIFYSRFQSVRWLIWGWTALQISLAGFLVRARRKAHQRILICIRCGAELR